MWNYLNESNQVLQNQYTNELTQSSILNETYTQSNLETEITEESSSQIKIKIEAPILNFISYHLFHQIL